MRQSVLSLLSGWAHRRLRLSHCVATRLIGAYHTLHFIRNKSGNLPETIFINLFADHCKRAVVEMNGAREIERVLVVCIGVVCISHVLNSEAMIEFGIDYSFLLQ